MMHFFENLTHPLAALLLFAWVTTLFGELVPSGIPSWRSAEGRNYGGLVAFLAFVIVLVVCFLAWCFQVFS